MLLDCHAKVLHDMKPVGDLFRLRRSLSGGLRVATAAIPAYDLHLGMTPQPVGACDDITIFANIDDGATLELFDGNAPGALATL